jgi:glutathione S-transferase
LFHLPNGAALKAGKWKSVFEKYEHVDMWFKQLQRRESWVKAAAVAGTIA